MKPFSFFVVLLFCLTHNIKAQDNWTLQTSGTTKNFLSCSFINANTGWIVGDSGVIIKTNNGGSTWSVQAIGRNINLYSVYFVDANTGWAVGDSGVIVRTINGGSSWTTLINGSTNSFSSVRFIDAETGWIVGKSGKIFKTINGGTSWIMQTSGTTKNLASIYFINATNGWIVGGGDPNYIILKTKDGGLNWSQIVETSNGTNNPLTSVYFVDANTGWTVGGSASGGYPMGYEVNMILKTIDGGVTWTTQTNPNSGMFLGGYWISVFFLNANTGWVVGYGGLIAKTTDGGSNWVLQSTGSASRPNSLNSVNFVDANTGWIVGSGGGILKHTSTTPIFMNVGTYSDFGILNNNRLQYQLLNRSRVSALIFDERGRLTFKLFDGNQSAGEYSLPLPKTSGSSILDFKADGIQKAMRLP